MEHSELKGKDVDTVFMGQVLQAGTGQNPARQAAMGAGIPNETISSTINQLCASGLTSVGYAYNSILLGEANIAVAGGQENMSSSPHAMMLRNGVKMGTGSLEGHNVKRWINLCIQQLSYGNYCRKCCGKISN